MTGGSARRTPRSASTSKPSTGWPWSPSGARVVLALAPTPAKAAKLTLAQLRAALKRSGRTRGFDTETARLREIFRSEYARHRPAVEDAFGQQLLALLKQLDAACQAADDLTTAAEAAFKEHADSEILPSFPGLGPLLGARLLAEIGDDRTRFADARALKSYAPARPRSPGPPARSTSSAAASSRTTGSSTLTFSGPSHPSPPHQERTPTTGAAANTETGTTPPNATCSTASSASSTIVSNPGSRSTNSAPSRHSFQLNWRA